MIIRFRDTRLGDRVKTQILIGDQEPLSYDGFIDTSFGAWQALGAALLLGAKAMNASTPGSIDVQIPDSDAVIRNAPPHREFGGGFIGQRIDADTVIVHGPDGEPLPLRLDLANHSPSGFEWGYEGSGPAQLALAILAEHLRDDALALRLYQRFKSETTARFRDDVWSLTPERIDAIVLNISGELR